MATKIINRGTYGTLVSQLDKLARHNCQGSFRTKERYYEAFKRSAPSWRIPTTFKSWRTSAASI